MFALAIIPMVVATVASLAMLLLYLLYLGISMSLVHLVIKPL